ncbi:MAG: tetratricopeptide repeat protein, partial [Thermoplasmata archaeon]
MRNAQVEGAVRDFAGKPVAEASVTLQGDAGYSAETKTTDTGAFSFLSVPAGSYTLKLAKSGFREVTDNSFDLAPAAKKHCDFVLSALHSSPPTAPTAPSPSSSGVAFDERPDFVVAGVTDSTGAGGHGSETRMRTGEALAKETLNLDSDELNAGASKKIAAANAASFEQARQQLNQMLASQKQLGKTGEADLHRQLGDLNEQLNDSLAAEHEYERAAGLDASERNYFAWGVELLLHRAVPPAIEVFATGVRLHPRSARMLAGLGAALYTTGAAEDAAQRLCQASDLEPSNPAPYLFLGQMQESTTAPLPCVEQKLARFAQDQPANALANYYYALTLWRKDRATENEASANSVTLEHVEALLKKSSDLDPKLGAADLQLGNLYFARGNFQQALAAYQKANAASPASSEAHYRLGLTYKRMGNGTKAEIEFNDYKQLDKTEAAAVERQRRELRQFIFILSDHVLNDHP